jgi:hypothetical protein
MNKKNIKFYESLVDFLKSKKKGKILAPVVGVFLASLTACTPTPKPDPDPDPDPILEFDVNDYIEEKTGVVEIAPGVKVDLQEFKQKEGLSFYFAEPFTKEEIDEMYEVYAPFYDELWEGLNSQMPDDDVRYDFMGMKHNDNQATLVEQEQNNIFKSFAKKVYLSNDPIYSEFKKFIEPVFDEYFFYLPVGFGTNPSEVDKRYTVIFFRFAREVYMNEVYPKLGITYKCDICQVQKTSFDPRNDYIRSNYVLDEEFLAGLTLTKHI